MNIFSFILIWNHENITNAGKKNQDEPAFTLLKSKICLSKELSLDEFICIGNFL